MSDDLNKLKVKMEMENEPYEDMLWTKSEIEERLCTVCGSILQRPKQLDCCGCRICDKCSINLTNSFKCPECLKCNPEIAPDKAYQNELESQRMNCPRCEQAKSVTLNYLLIHIEEHRDLKCHDCEEIFVLPQELEKHERDQCKNRKVPCVLEFMGCSKAVPCNKLADHGLTAKHQKHVIKFIKQIFRFYSGGRTKLPLRRLLNDKDREHLINISTKLDLLARESLAMVENCTSLDSKRETMLTKINEIQKKCEQIAQLFNNSAKVLESLHQILLTMQQMIDEIKPKLTKGVRLLSGDGTFIDKANFKSIKDGQTGRSGIFHTSQSGYALEMLYERYIDQYNQQNYFSISLVMHVGEFDAILTWPMIYPITLKIIDLTTAQKHIVYWIDSGKMMFGRPTIENNIYRVHQFCTIETLEKGSNYIQDGCVFVQIQMDFIAPGTSSISEKAVQKPLEDYIHRNIVENIS